MLDHTEPTREHFRSSARPARSVSRERVRRAGQHAKVVLDVGLNNGKDTEFFLRQGHAVVAVDANPQWVQAARARWASEIAARRLLVLCVGPRDTQTFKFLPRCE